MYGESAPLQELIHDMPGGGLFKLTSASEQFTEIERQILGGKESIRSIQHSLPFNKIPNIFLIHLVFQAIKILTHFPVKGGVYDTIIPTTIMTGNSLHYKKHIGLNIEQYCQVHEEDTPYNINKPRTKGAIYMVPSENLQGGFKFMSLRSMGNINSKYWDMIPMPDTVIDWVNLLGKYQPEILVSSYLRVRLVFNCGVYLTLVDGGGN